ncbi:MAG TPA: sugar phosphate nucleotidyltransferase [Chloroflexota bacterium]
MQYAVIMAGGAGTRLWPAARRESPKQLQRLIFEQPLIAETVQRFTGVYEPERILIVTARRYADSIRESLPNVPAGNIISEPVGRNTAAAIALAAFRIARDDPKGVFAVFPADHVILKPESLFQALDFANELALHHRVVDIGVPPSHPETGYGYIELGRELERRDGLVAHEVERFVEKPSLEKAQEYVRAGNYIWNSGMFVWRATEYLRALEEYLPDTYTRLEAPFRSGSWDELSEAYARIDDISVDYAIMERTSDVVAVPVDFGWRDIGDWSALYDMMDHDENGNAFGGPHAYLDTENCLLFAPNKLIATIGLRDLVVVDTDDVILIMPRSRSQEVKTLLERIEETGQDSYL